MPASPLRALSVRPLACVAVVAAAALVLPACAAPVDPLALSSASTSEPLSPSEVSSSSSSSSSSSRAPPQPAGPPAAAIVCIVLGCCLVLPGVCVAVFMACRRSRRATGYAFVSDAVCRPQHTMYPLFLSRTCIHTQTQLESQMVRTEDVLGPSDA